MCTLTTFPTGVWDFFTQYLSWPEIRCLAASCRDARKKCGRVVRLQRVSNASPEITKAVDKNTHRLLSLFAKKRLTDADRSTLINFTNATTGTFRVDIHAVFRGYLRSRFWQTPSLEAAAPLQYRVLERLIRYGGRWRSHINSVMFIPHFHDPSFSYEAMHFIRLFETLEWVDPLFLGSTSHSCLTSQLVRAVLYDLQSIEYIHRVDNVLRKTFHNQLEDVLLMIDVYTRMPCRFVSVQAHRMFMKDHLIKVCNEKIEAMCTTVRQNKKKRKRDGQKLDEQL